MISGNNGILTKVGQASEAQKDAVEDEEVKMAVITAIASDDYGNLTDANLREAITNAFGNPDKLTGTGPWTYEGERNTYNIDENNQVINESFDIKLRYTNVGSEVTNKVESRLIYGNNEITDEDKVTDKVPYGVVIATYKDTDGNELTTEVKTIDLVGKEYNTEEKDFFGYSLKEINGNENGTYIDDTIYVEYIYTNTMGTGDIEELPPQTGVEQSNLYNYLIIISMLVLSVRGYKKVKETL